MTTALSFVLLVFGIPADGPKSDRPLPDPRQLRERALTNLKRSEKDLERYSCEVHTQTDDLNANGTVKRHKTKVSERFFVNGIEINHVLERDGRPLDRDAAKKEQERVDKEVKK